MRTTTGRLIRLRSRRFTQVTYQVNEAKKGELLRGQNDSGEIPMRDRVVLLQSELLVSGLAILDLNGNGFLNAVLFEPDII